MIKNQDIIDRMKAGNEKYLSAKTGSGNISPEIREDTTKNGQHPYAIVVTCSDSRVIPEAIFSAGIGEIFVIRVAGNVMGDHQLGSVEYAAAHLHSNVIVVLGHTNCGAVGAALEGDGEGYIKFLTDEVKAAIGSERDPYKACCLNVERSISKIKKIVDESAELKEAQPDVVGAVYNIESGKVEWL